MTGSRWTLLRWLVFSSYAVLVGFLSLSPIVPSMPNDSDKLAHWFAYCGFAVLAIIVVRNKSQHILCCLMIILYGWLLEIAQGFSLYRSMSVLDFIANCFGVIVGYFIVRLLADGRWFRR